MQYLLYAFKYYHGNILIGKYNELNQALIAMDRLDRDEYEYADIIETEWNKPPKVVSSVSFELEKEKRLTR